MGCAMGTEGGGWNRPPRDGDDNDDHEWAIDRKGVLTFEGLLSLGIVDIKSAEDCWFCDVARVTAEGGNPSTETLLVDLPLYCCSSCQNHFGDVVVTDRTPDATFNTLMARATERKVIPLDVFHHFDVVRCAAPHPDTPGTTASANAADGDDTCAVCSDDLHVNRYCLTFPCKSRHRFHRRCLRPWLEQHRSCPSCRHTVPMDTPLLPVVDHLMTVFTETELRRRLGVLLYFAAADAAADAVADRYLPDAAPSSAAGRDDDGDGPASLPAPPVEADEAAAARWSSFVDEASGRTYYHDAATGHLTWDAPPAAETATATAAWLAPAASSPLAPAAGTALLSAEEQQERLRKQDLARRIVGMIKNKRYKVELAQRPLKSLFGASGATAAAVAAVAAAAAAAAGSDTDGSYRYREPTKPYAPAAAAVVGAGGGARPRSRVTHCDLRYNRFTLWVAGVNANLDLWIYTAAR